MKALYRITYCDAQNVDRKIVTDDINRDAPGWRSQSGWERVPRPDGRESVLVQYLRGGGHIGTLGEIESPFCLSLSWAEHTMEATGPVEGMPDWLAKIYTPPLAIYSSGENVPLAPPEEKQRVRDLAVAMIRAALETNSEFAAIVAERRSSNIAVLERHQREQRTAAAHPSLIQNIRRKLGRKRVISPEHLTAIIHLVAPDEAAPEKIISALRDNPNSITFWSPDGIGGMRYDQPGTISHQPLIAFVPRHLHHQRLPSNLDSSLVLRLTA